MIPTSSGEVPSDQKDGYGSDSDSSCCGTSRLRRGSGYQVSHRSYLPVQHNASLSESRRICLSVHGFVHADIADLPRTSVGECPGAHRAGFKGGAAGGCHEQAPLAHHGALLFADGAKSHGSCKLG